MGQRQSVTLWNWRYATLKRGIDLGVCILLLPLALPLMAVTAGLIFLEDRGPILLRQPRTGLAGKSFKMLKFRTMVPNAEERKKELLAFNELSWPDFKMKDDPRVTRIGKWLRKTSLDELPQLINVIVGDMSLVGPRPTSFSSDTYQLWHTERLEVLPGITGLWQISGRSELDFDQRVELDIEYIERRSIGLDIAILFGTFGAVFSARGAS